MIVFGMHRSKKRINDTLLIVLFIICSIFSNKSFSQNHQKQSFRLQDTSLYAQDIILVDGDVFALANMNEFEAIRPIEGTLNTGSVIVKLDEDLDIQWSATYQTAIAMGLTILQEPRNEFYGQRRFLLKDPNGCLIDVCSPWEPQ